VAAFGVDRIDARMPPPFPRDPLALAGTLLVGPGPRGRDLAAVLRALAEPRGVAVRAFEDVAELAPSAETSGVFLLDVDAVPVEDLGYVRRFLAARADIDVVLLGTDPRVRAARYLGSQRFTAWPPDVEELLALVTAAAGGAELTPGAGRASAAAPAPVSTPSPTSTRARATEVGAPSSRGSAAATLESDELDQVRAILEQETTSEEFAPPADWPPAAQAPAPATGSERSRGSSAARGEAQPREPQAREPQAHEARARNEAEPRSESRQRSEPRPRVEPTPHEPTPHEPERTGASALEAEGRVESQLDNRNDPFAEMPAPTSEFSASHAAAPGKRTLEAPPWWRAQVADLADSAQRIDLSVRALAEAAPEIDEGDLDEARDRLRALEGEVARLMQFTRTLGYVASPPPTGSQTFDLGEIVHLFAAGLAQSGPEAPRCQYKTVPTAIVRSDRQLLSQALDAVFFLVRCTSRKGDLVRAQVQRVEDPAGVVIELSLDFPSGPLEGIPADEIVEPYALSDLFPELGPNALAAAAGIVSGQGGSLSLSSKAAGRMTWRLRLPRLET